MGRNSINWMNPDVQQYINDYIHRKIPTQAKLRQVISNHLQQNISEQALSIYLKRSGLSGYSRKTNSPASLKPNQSVESSPGGGVENHLNSSITSKQQSAVASSTIASLSSALSAHQLPNTEHFYNQHPLFLNGVNSSASGACGSSSVASSSSAAVIVDPNSNSVNFVHVSSPATFSNILDMSNNAALRGVVGNTNNCNNGGMLGMTSAGNTSNIQRYILEDSQQLHRAAEMHNLQLQQQIQWQQQQQQNANSSTATNNNTNSNSNNTNDTGDTCSGSNNANNNSKSKRLSTSSQPINWKDPFVQCAISSYFNKKIKLQTELRQVIMQRLKRNISENSLRLHLKKLKSSYDSSTSLSQASLTSTSNNAASVLINDAFRHLSSSKDNNLSLQDQSQQNQQHHGITAATTSICPTATAMPIISSPSKELYYFCNNLSLTQPVAYATTTGHVGHHSMLGSIETYGFNDGNIKSLQVAPATMVKTINEQFIKINNSSGDNNADLMNVVNESIKSDKDDTKPSVRRRINWGNAEVQNAIQDFYDRKILTQAKLRSIIESILGQIVSEQALSIYLKRKVFLTIL